MTHDQATTLLAPLARERAPRTRDVTESVMRDVRRLATAEEDGRVWRVAALLGATAATAVVVASFALAPADNPLADFAQQSTQALEAR